MNQDPIFQKIDHATPVDFGGILSKSFELFKKVWVEALLHALVSIAIFIPFLIIIYAPLLPFYAEMIQTIGNPNYNPDNLLEGYGIEMIIGWAVLVFIIAFLIQPLAYSITGHFMQHCKKALWKAFLTFSSYNGNSNSSCSVVLFAFVLCNGTTYSITPGFCF